MAYTPSTFVDSSTTIPISAAQLNKLGDGIAQVQAIAEEAATSAEATTAAATRITDSLARYSVAVRTSDSSAVTSTSLTLDGELQLTTLTAVTGKRIKVAFNVLFRGDFAASPVVRFGVSATDADLDVTGHMYLSALRADGTGNTGTCTALDSAGQATAAVAVLSGTTAGTDPGDVYYVSGSASLLVGPSTGNVTIGILSAQANALGTGVKILKGSTMTTEVLT